LSFNWGVREVINACCSAKLSIYEFSEDSPSNGLGLYELTLPVDDDWDINVFSIHQNVVVFVEGRNLYVWNMVEDTGTAWVVGEASFEEASTIFLHVGWGITLFIP